jgi:uncharacterized membrane protein YeiH
MFGVMVPSFAAALGGGTMRDLLIGAGPPQSIRDWRYAVVAFIRGAVVIVFHPWLQRVPFSLSVVLDAAGLSLFAAAGAGKALRASGRKASTCDACQESCSCSHFDR